MAQPIFEGGFRSPVFDAQAVFRALMDAMARPGSLQALSIAVEAPAPLNAGAGAVLLALADADTPVWLDKASRKNPALAQWIAFHTGAPVTEDRAEADFAVIAEAGEGLDLGGFRLGSQEYPDRSTTLILCVPGFGAGAALTCAGPGIKTTAAFAPDALPENFLDAWRANQAQFPRGVDVVFAGSGQLAGLPRTTRLSQNVEA